MKGQLSRNPFFYLTIALVFVVAFEVVNLVRAQYAGPTNSPTGGQPAQPLDTSSFGQVKIGGLTTNNDLTMAGSNGSVSLSSTAGVPVLTFSNGSAFGKLWLAPIGGGTIMAHSGGKDFEIGTGSGTGFWTAVSGGILYNGGNVTIDNSNSGSQTGFWADGNVIIGQNNEYDKFKMPCDASDFLAECINSFYADPGTGNYIQGQKYYDGFQIADPRDTKRIFYKGFIFETRASAGTNTAVLSVGDVRLASGVSVTPPGTWCGLHDGIALRWNCYGYNPGPPNRSCPPGWTHQKFGLGSGADFPNDWETCVKN